MESIVIDIKRPSVLRAEYRLRYLETLIDMLGEKIAECDGVPFSLSDLIEDVVDAKNYNPVSPWTDAEVNRRMERDGDKEA